MAKNSNLLRNFLTIRKQGVIYLIINQKNESSLIMKKYQYKLIIQ